ncbi:MAG: queuosine salvage family protein [Terriglobia bacterium]
MLSLASNSCSGSSEGGGPVRRPRPIGSPVLESVVPVIEQSRHVRTVVDKIGEVADWMALEDLPVPEFALPFVASEEPKRAIDFILVGGALDFAFTDFDTAVIFQVDFAGQRWSDADAMFACLRRALDQGVPLLEGGYLSGVTRKDLEGIFRANIEIPLLDERVEILRAVGKRLVESYGGHFHNFVAAASPRLYDGGKGLLEKLIAEFPRFDDVSDYHGHEVKFYKLAQLSLWMLYGTLHRSGAFTLEDLPKMTAFADYILPLALRAMRIFRYTPELDDAIENHREIRRDSEEEIEIRAHTLYATALLTEEINKRRPSELQVIIPQIDARLWTHYHKNFRPHHLTRTIMY